MMYFLAHTNKDVFVQLSPEDFDLADKQWTIAQDGYPMGRWEKRRIKLHRLVAERMTNGVISEGFVVDHKDGDVLNCQRSNLRIATHQQNTQNQKPRSGTKSGYKGVTTNGCGRSWYVQIRHDGKREIYGPYKTPLEAARIYNEKAKEYFGEFAWLNDIPQEEEI